MKKKYLKEQHVEKQLNKISIISTDEAMYQLNVERFSMLPIIISKLSKIKYLHPQNDH